MQIRLANSNDVNSLFELNELFNGPGCTTKEQLADSILNNNQETVFVAIIDGKMIGFCCVQLFKSMCYSSNYAEITELFVKEEYRKHVECVVLMSRVEK